MSACVSVSCGQRREDLHSVLDLLDNALVMGGRGVGVGRVGVGRSAVHRVGCSLGDALLVVGLGVTDVSCQCHSSSKQHKNQSTYAAA